MLELDAKAKLYFEKFGEWPPNQYGMTDERLEELIDKALASGAPISDEDLEGGIPDDAVA